MESVFSVLFNTGHQAPGWGLLAVMILLAVVLPPLMNRWARRRSEGQDCRNQKHKHR